MTHPSFAPAIHPDNICEIADFAELECLKRDDHNVSTTDISRILTRSSGDEEDESDAADEANEQFIIEAFAECQDRLLHCGHNQKAYPFEVLHSGTLLQARDSGKGKYISQRALYVFLLLSTRMNMNSERKQGSDDATKIFEELGKEVGVRLWGGPCESVHGLIFGTGGQTAHLDDDDDFTEGVFKAAVDKLCRELGEGHGFQCNPGARVRARDGKLDVVVWRRFTDGRAGQLIGFGQCKTGTHWKGDLTKLRLTGSFCKKWMQRSTAVDPVPLYFIADREDSRYWRDTCIDGGILMDRCRIVEYSVDLPNPLLQRVRRWIGAACESQGLRWP